MKSTHTGLNRFGVSCTRAIVGISLMLSLQSHASQGATDPIPGTSKGTVKSGGGTTTVVATPAKGGGKAGGGTAVVSPPTVVLPPIPTTPIQPLVTGTLAMTGSLYNGTTVQCTGTYRIDPYYPTLSLATVDLSLSSVSGSDGAPMFVTVGIAGTAYPFLGGSFVIVGTGGTAHTQVYVSPGSTITGVTVMDLTGNIVASGK